MPSVCAYLNLNKTFITYCSMINRKFDIMNNLNNCGSNFEPFASLTLIKQGLAGGFGCTAQHLRT